MDETKIELNADDVQERLDYLQKCCLETTANVRVSEVISTWDTNPGGTDREGGVLFKTSDGTFGYLEDSEDYTGHG